MSNEHGYVVAHRNNKSVTIEFFHPLSNSLPANLLKALADLIKEAGEDPTVHVIILRSGGDRAFCGGASFEELMSIEDEQQGKIFFSGFAGVINAIRTCGKIVVCRLQGKAVGGGVGIASAADVSLATKYASVRLSELAVGIGPFVIGPAVERKIGTAAFTYMSVTPDEWQSAEWALQKGLYSQIFDDTKGLDAYIDQLVDKFEKYNPEALTELKKVFWQGTDHWEELLAVRAETSGQLVLSAYTRSAINNFKSKA